MPESQFYNLFKFDLNHLSYQTALLETCGWDEEELEKTLEIVHSFLQCFFLPPSPKSIPNFESWIKSQIGEELIRLGLSKEQSRIVCDLIINRKEEFMILINLEEN